MLRIFVIICNLPMLAYGIFGLSEWGIPDSPKEVILVFLLFVAPIANLRYVYIFREAQNPPLEPSTLELFRQMVRAKLRNAARTTSGPE